MTGGRSWRSHASLRAAGWLLLAALLALGLRAVPWQELPSAFSRASPGWIVLAMLIHLTLLPLGAWQWMQLLPAGACIPFRDMLWIRSVGWAVANGGPFLAEQATSVHLLATRGRVGYATGTSVKILDQVTVGAGKVILLVATLAVAPLPPSLRAAAVGLVILAPLLAAAALAAVRGESALERRASGAAGRRRDALVFLARVAGRLEAIRRPGAVGRGVVLVLLQKAAEAAACWAVLLSVGAAPSLAGVLLVVTAVNLSTMLSVTPANLGIFEASAYASLRLADVAAGPALAAAVLLHVTYLAPVAGTGWVLMAAEALGVRRRSLGADRSHVPGHRRPGPGSVGPQLGDDLEAIDGGVASETLDGPQDVRRGLITTGPVEDLLTERRIRR